MGISVGSPRKLSIFTIKNIRYGIKVSEKRLFDSENKITCMEGGTFSKYRWDVLVSSKYSLKRLDKAM